MVAYRCDNSDPRGNPFLVDLIPCPGRNKEPLRLLEQGIARVQEEFQHAERANKEKASVERDGCLASAGEVWRMTLRQENALDCSIHRKVKILLSLRKECTLPAIPFDQEDDLEMETINKTPGN